MKVVRNTCDKELGGEIKSACEWKLLQKFTIKLPKFNPFQRGLCKTFKEKQNIGIVYSYNHGQNI